MDVDIAKSLSDAKRLIRGGCVQLDGRLVTSETEAIASTLERKILLSVRGRVDLALDLR